MKYPFAILFPGQGSQSVGMGETFRGIELFQNHLQQANTLFGGDLGHFMFQGDSKELTQTEVAQPALLTVACGIFAVLQQQLSDRPSYVLGHSLGEYSALVAAEVLTFQEAFQLVQVRAQLMQAACVKKPGAMVAVLKPDVEVIQDTLAQDKYRDRIVIANYNEPQQIVLSGEKEKMPELLTELKTKGLKRAIPLNVSGAFHSPLMDEGQRALGSTIDRIAFMDAQIPVVTNVDGHITEEASEFKAKLKRQLTAPVQWERSIRLLAEKGIYHFVECGPGQVLSNLVKRIVPNSHILNISEQIQLAALPDFLSHNG